jgi:methionine synthase II (cobalamin-independent)
VRPPALKEQRQIHADGQCSLEDLKPYEDAAIKESIELLRSVGIKTLTDGELRR